MRPPPGSSGRVTIRVELAISGRKMRLAIPVEARTLRALVDAMPAERRSAIDARFAAAHEQLEATGMLERLREREQNSREERIALGMDYFHLRLPCPFLEEESCSIHPDRPVACREYLVTSPAINCFEPTPETVDVVEITAKVSNAVAGLDAGTSRTAADGWVPLVLALDWAAKNPDRSLPEPGPDILKKLFDTLAK